MPPRLAPRLTTSPARIITCPSICRAFHCSLLRHDYASKNHYERLNIRHDASPGEIKKSFYSLSKSHHPDVNRSDPNAAQTFSLLSESYTILSDPTRRAKYDRETLRLHQSHHRHAHPHAGASYHSSNPAGGRSPSGLSRRRGTFRGPPPSFYKNGGWGAHSDRRKEAHEETTSQTQKTNPNPSPWGDPFAHPQHGGMGPGSNPFGASRPDDAVPHFDKTSHTRTHKKEDERRYRRRAMGDDDVEFEPQTSLAGHFLIVAGILGATFVAPLVYLQLRRLGRQERDKG